MNVIEVKKKPSELVIARLKEMLEKAENGEITSIAIAGTTTDRGIISCWHCDEEVFLLVAATHALIHDFMHCEIEMRED